MWCGSMRRDGTQCSVAWARGSGELSGRWPSTSARARRLRCCRGSRARSTSSWTTTGRATSTIVASGQGPRRFEYPSLIWCSITGYGQDGPYARFAGHDITYTAFSGLLAAINPELPWYPQLVLSLPIAALMATTGIVTALYDRQRTGKGAHIDISMSEAASWLLGGSEGQLSDSAFGIPISASRRLYQCADSRWVSVAADEPRTWSALCKGLGLDDIADTRPADQEEAARRIGEVLRTRPAAEWVAELGPIGSTVSAVHEGSTLLDDPQVRARGGVVEVDGKPIPANPIRINGPDGPRATTVTTPPPGAGSQTDEVLSEAGFSPKEIDELRSSGVFGEASELRDRSVWQDGARDRWWSRRWRDDLRDAGLGRRQGPRE